MLECIRNDVKERITETMTSDGDQYRTTVQQMIVQGMIRLLEENVELLVREGETDLIQGMIDECQTQYADIMLQETTKEYNTTLTIREDRFLTKEEGSEYGGVIMFAHSRKIVVSNTLLDRVNLVFE